MSPISRLLIVDVDDEAVEAVTVVVVVGGIAAFCSGCLFVESIGTI